MLFCAKRVCASAPAEDPVLAGVATFGAFSFFVLFACAAASPLVWHGAWNPGYATAAMRAICCCNCCCSCIALSSDAWSVNICPARTECSPASAGPDASAARHCCAPPATNALACVSPCIPPPKGEGRSRFSTCMLACTSCSSPMIAPSSSEASSPSPTRVSDEFPDFPEAFGDPGAKKPGADSKRRRLPPIPGNGSLARAASTRRNVLLKRFFTWLSVLPGMLREMTAHLLP
mmetsp:Transcript_6353/g.21286  ORF Transcript_6353/g.21286 Transcript_6353/m.21286 type:complete len:233 (+) Transcript_6353:379-1077(+)